MSAAQIDFYPRPLRGGRLRTIHLGALTIYISIHALCEEGDLIREGKMKHECYFYPRPLRGGRLFLEDDYISNYTISIHALCEEGDPPSRRSDSQAG